MILKKSLLLGFVLLYSMGLLSIELSNYIKSTIIDKNGENIVSISFPGKPPLGIVGPLTRPSREAVILDSVPAFDWSYGCSSTSAAMLVGFYDNREYPNFYTGPVNGGVTPLNNEVWGYGECPLSATKLGLDGRLTKGHVDDYWIEAGNNGPDPFIENGWDEHDWDDCTADFMGTSQSEFGNTDGETTFYFYTNGSPLYDYTDCEPEEKDGCHGMKEFIHSKNYSVIENFSQYIYGYEGNEQGFTFEQFKNEIDNNRPVLVQVVGHTMLGYGYDQDSTIFIHDTWDHNNHEMAWGGNYCGLDHFGVTVINPSTFFDRTSWYVATTGSDSTGDGSFENPFASIQHTMDLMTDSDTLYILPGTYHESSHTNNTNPTIIGLASEDEEVVINASYENGIHGTFSLIKNISFTNCEKGIRTSHDCVIHNCKFYDNSVGIAGSTGSRTLISNCLFYSCNKGFHQYYNGGDSYIQNSTFTDNSTDVLWDPYWSTATLYIKNSILRNSLSCSSTWPIEISYCNYNPDLCSQSVISDSSSFNLDPGFNDYINQDYTLDTSSPCIDSGDENIFYNDLDGTRNDLGFTGGSGLFLNFSRVDFGYIRFNQNVSFDLLIANFTELPFLIESFFFSETLFNSSNEFPFLIDPGCFMEFNIFFNSNRYSAINDTLNIYSSDLNGDVCAVKSKFVCKFLILDFTQFS